MTKFYVTEYRIQQGRTETNGPIEVEAENGPLAICAALGMASVPSYAHDGQHMVCHAQFDGHGTWGAHAKLDPTPLVL